MDLKPDDRRLHLSPGFKIELLDKMWVFCGIDGNSIVLRDEDSKPTTKEATFENGRRGLGNALIDDDSAWVNDRLFRPGLAGAPFGVRE